jgi:hypothetical protein
LGDVLPLPNMPPIRGVYSIGDIFIFIGGEIFIQRALKPPKAGSATGKFSLTRESLRQVGWAGSLLCPAQPIE